MSEMRFSISRWFLFLIFLAASIKGATQDGMKFQEQYQVKLKKANAPIKIDGILDDG